MSDREVARFETSLTFRMFFLETRQSLESQGVSAPVRAARNRVDRFGIGMGMGQLERTLAENDPGRFSRCSGDSQAERRSSPKVAPRQSSVRLRRFTWVLGGIAAALLVVFWLIQIKFIDLDVVRAALLSRVAGICPNKAEAYTFLGEHYSTAGRTNAAVDACEKLVQVEPESPHSHVLLGDAYRGVSRPEEAIACYQAALQRDPNCYEAHLGLGRAYTSVGRYDEAIHSYEQAVSVQPESVTAYVSLGLVLSDLGRYDEAMKAFQQAKELDPEISEAQLLSGKAYLQAGLNNEAVECFKDAVRTDQEHAQACFNLGRAYLRVGERDLALDQQRKLRALDTQMAERLLDLIER